MENISIEIMILITGIIVVFFVLIALTFIVKLFGIIISKINFELDNKKVRTINNIDYIDKKIEYDDIISDEIIAVISAAVCNLYGNNNRKKILFKSIRRVNNKCNNIWNLKSYETNITSIYMK